MKKKQIKNRFNDLFVSETFICCLIVWLTKGVFKASVSFSIITEYFF